MPPDAPEPGSRETQLAALLDLDFGAFSDDLGFYENMARAGDRNVMELGIGAGRVAAHLARAAIEVWGVETCESLIFCASRNAGPEASRLHIQCADMRAFELGRQFDLGYAAFGTFHHLLTRDDQLACLRCVRRHLTPGGLFAFDLRPYHLVDWEPGDSAPLLHDWTRPLPGTSDVVTKLRSVRPDAAHQLLRELHIYDRVAPDGSLRRLTAEVDLRFSTRYEVGGLLREAGLELDRVYGDFDLAPYEGDSEYMITVARRPAEDAR